MMNVAAQNSADKNLLMPFSLLIHYRNTNLTECRKTDKAISDRFVIFASESGPAMRHIVTGIVRLAVPIPIPNSLPR